MAAGWLDSPGAEDGGAARPGGSSSDPLKQREPGLFGLVLAISEALVRTAVAGSARFCMTPDPTVASRALPT
jgi:hypothetical protein